MPTGPDLRLYEERVTGIERHGQLGRQDPPDPYALVGGLNGPLGECS
jgi:hypothetical protein